MVAAYPKGEARYAPHSDWYDHEVTNNRFLTCLLYFNPGDWSPELDGGELCTENQS